jgi:hypothetical protein
MLVYKLYYLYLQVSGGNVYKGTITLSYMKLLADIPDNINKFLKIEKIKRGKKNIQEVLIEILREVMDGRN